jgi:hypothetical protein
MPTFIVLSAGHPHSGRSCNAGKTLSSKEWCFILEMSEEGHGPNLPSSTSCLIRFSLSLFCLAYFAIKTIRPVKP